MPAPEYVERVEAARAGWRRFDEAIPIVPLVQSGGDEWIGVLVRSDRSTISLRYSRARGLEFG
jgi:CRISPR-associated endonuclease/helicase Cas3